MALGLDRFVLQVDVDHVEESMQMIGGLQLLACTQFSRYVINEASWVCNDAFQVAFDWIFLDNG